MRRQRIAVLRALALGDMLCAIPALRALRRGFPDARITLIGLPWAHALPGRFEVIDEVVDFPGFPAIEEVPVDPARLAGFIGDMQADPFDLAINLHGDGRVSNLFLSLLGAEAMAGPALPGEWQPPGAFTPYATNDHEIRRLLAVVAGLGIAADDDRLELPLTPIDAIELAQALDGASLHPGTYAVLHPGASHAGRRWPPASFAAVGDWLSARGLDVVLTGSAAEREVTAGVARLMRAPALDLAGETSLGALGVLVHQARLVITNDTAMSHVAAAIATPSVVIFLTSERARWAPLDTRLHRAVGEGAPVPRSFDAVQCRSLAHDSVGAGGVRPPADVPFGEVLAAADDLLRSARPTAAIPSVPER